ncbi:hypothetical protein FB451DRAFT_71482 [Mycena latifolia]|nr:hypothetical protein FB451DRAFT_71482 [Mycena latifolia]
MKAELPIHERALVVDPQDASPLYNGRIPPEIRNALFEAILAEYADPANTYPENLHRPDRTGARTLSVALLRTCRRVYLETYHLPPLLKTHVFWHGPATGPPAFGARFPDIHGIAPRAGLLHPSTAMAARARGEPAPLHADVLARPELFGALPQRPCTQRRAAAHHAKGRRLVVVRAQVPVHPQPHRGGYLEEMRTDIAREKRGEVLPWAEGGWGGALQHLPALKELEMEFETTVDRKEELRTIVKRALTWKFPMGERGVLSNEGLGMELIDWQGHEKYCLFTVKWKLVGRNS